MAIQVYNQIYNCTPAQFAVAVATTLPAYGWAVLQAPINFQGIIISNAQVVTLTGTLTTSSATIAMASTVGIVLGDVVTGTGIGTTPSPTVIAIVPNTSVTLSSAAAVTGTGAQSLTFTPAVLGSNQVDFGYDGQYFLRFFDAGPAPVAAQSQSGIPQSQMTPAVIANLILAFAATLGAPVPSNQAVPPYATNNT